VIAEIYEELEKAEYDNEDLRSQIYPPHKLAEILEDTVSLLTLAN
jgi:hypothetical protein